MNYTIIPNPGSANNAPDSDGTPGPYQTSSTLVPNPGKADGKIGTGSNQTFIPKATPVPNPAKADGMTGTGSNLNYIPESKPVPNPTKADGNVGTGSNLGMIYTGQSPVTYVPNPNKADGQGTGTPTPPTPPVYIPFLHGADPNLLITDYAGPPPAYWNLEYGTGPGPNDGWFVGDTTTDTPAMWIFEVFGYFYRSIGYDSNNNPVTPYSNVWGGDNQPP